MTTEFHAWPYRKFIVIQNNLRRETFYGTNQGSNFLAVLAIEVIAEPKFNVERKSTQAS